jgi:hypothetical protein
MLLIYSNGLIVSARFGYLCSTVRLDPDADADVGLPDMMAQGRLPA